MRAAESPIGPGTHSLFSILIVDDDHTSVPFLRAALAGLGHRVETALDCATAIEKLTDTDRRFDVLLANVKLPDGDGRSLADSARKRGAEIAVVFMSGSASALAGLRRSNPGVPVLSKPLDIDQLRSVLAAIEAD